MDWPVPRAKRRREVEVEVVVLIWVCYYSAVAGLHLAVVEKEEGQSGGHWSTGKQSMEEELEVVAIV